MKKDKVVMRGRVNKNLAEEFELGSQRTVIALVEELKFGSSVYDKTDDHKNAVMPLLLRVIVRELSGYDIRTMTDKEIERLAFRLVVGMDALRELADPGIIAIEDAIKELRSQQKDID